ncbi:JAB domain-containing protein [Lactobacillus psittaci]|uniref:DNA repair protein RadC n=1 Tax=Lactobacillus psittaci DSM 15354 TaxID=1122152 RepID=A0A0R1S7F1_9LACO|nr:JAB domain-containing protein [Lactobacillus psittaci]KRL63460.1 DNA repair protein RadC [Lactobacillus psittaci DSM 15354]
MKIPKQDHYLLKTDQELLDEIFFLLKEDGITTFEDLKKFLEREKLTSFNKIFDYLAGKSEEALTSRSFSLLMRLREMKSGHLESFVSSHEVGGYLTEKFLGVEQEQLVVFYLDNKNQVISERLLFQGTVNRSVVHPRDIFRWGVLCNSVSFLMAHNHPSGDLTPSEKDIEFTRQIEAAAKLIGINYLDHIIVAGKQYLSFKEEQLY